MSNRCQNIQFNFLPFMISTKKNINPKQLWINLAQFQNRFILFYQPYVIDLTQFIKKHPGGIQAIKNYYCKQIKQILFKVYPHPQSILQILFKYTIGAYYSQSYKSKTKEYSQKIQRSDNAKTSFKNRSMIINKDSQINRNSFDDKNYLSFSQKKKVSFNIESNSENKRKQQNKNAKKHKSKKEIFQQQNDANDELKSYQIRQKKNLIPTFTVKFMKSVKENDQLKIQIKTKDLSMILKQQ